MLRSDIKNLDNITDIKQLIQLAIDDNEKLAELIEKGEKYERNMDVWHFKSETRNTCAMCMAGAVMKNSLDFPDNVDVHAEEDNLYGTDYLKERDCDLLNLIDRVRCLSTDFNYDHGKGEKGEIQTYLIPVGFNMYNYEEVSRLIRNRSTRETIKISGGHVESWKKMLKMIK